MCILSKVQRTTNVLVSSHAKERIVQRFKLFMTPAEISNPTSFIIDEYRNAWIDKKYLTSPLNLSRNMKKGKMYDIAFYAVTGNFVLCCNYSPDTDSVNISTLFRRHNTPYRDMSF